MDALDPATTALVLIDLQNGIVGMPTEPRDGADVVATAKALATRFRDAGAPVVLVHVGFEAGAVDLPSQKVDRPGMAAAASAPAEWMQLVEGLERPGDIVVLKRHWGAFTGTDLDVRLRRRGIRTIVLAGIATNMGVESTARAAWELGYDLVIPEDVTTSRSTDMHHFAVATIFPQIARVVQSADIVLG